MNNCDLTPLFREIIKAFELNGELSEIECIGSGNINDTYVVTTNQGDEKGYYIFQRVNHRVFKNPERVAENVCRVTDHVIEKLVAAGESDISRRAMRYYRKPDGSTFYINSDGEYWRVLSCIYNAVSVDFADIHHLRQAGIAFGEFQNHLADFPAESLYETIPDFHNTKKRYDDLRLAAEKDVANRLCEVREEYEYLLSMQREACLLCELSENGKLPKRVVHNDTKCNNVMFDKDTGEHLAVIDLDTVMSGLTAYDFGDAVRFAANPGGEDNENLSEIYLDCDYYSAFTEGFVPCIYGKVTDIEIATLPDGVLAITLELAARFLTDYLNGDVYFKCKKERHNLKRTRAQIKLARDIFGKMPELRARLETITKSL